MTKANCLSKVKSSFFTYLQIASTKMSSPYIFGSQVLSLCPLPHKDAKRICGGDLYEISSFCLFTFIDDNFSFFSPTSNLVIFCSIPPHLPLDTTIFKQYLHRILACCDRGGWSLFDTSLTRNLKVYRTARKTCFGSSWK